MKSLSRTYPTPELRFYRRPNGKAILQQRWCTTTTTTADPAKKLLIHVPEGETEEYFWQDVPMVTE